MTTETNQGRSGQEKPPCSNGPILNHAQSSNASIRPRLLAWLGGAVALVAIGTAAFISRQPFPERTEANSKSANVATFLAKPVQPSLVLPIAVEGQAHQEGLLPTNVKEALYGKEFSWDARLRFIGDLGSSLSPADVGLLLDYTKQRQPDDGISIEQRRALKNDTFFVLRSQKPAPAGLTAFIIGIYRDKGQDPGIRDYAIQQLSEWRWRAVLDNPGDARAIDNALWAAAGETDQPLSGTALLALGRLVADTKMPDHAAYAAEYEQRLAQAARALVADEKAPLAGRISALGISAQNSTEEDTALIRKILSQDNPPPMLQLAALGALVKTLPPGIPLEAQTRAIFERAAHSNYPPLKRLAATALRQRTF